MNYCPDCQKLTSGKCPKHSMFTVIYQSDKIQGIQIKSQEFCSCGREATHKIAEEIIERFRHPFTTYLCCECFGNLMGPVAKKWCKNAHGLLEGIAE